MSCRWIRSTGISRLFWQRQVVSARMLAQDSLFSWAQEFRCEIDTTLFMEVSSHALRPATGDCTVEGSRRLCWAIGGSRCHGTVANRSYWFQCCSSGTSSLADLRSFRFQIFPKLRFKCPSHAVRLDPLDHQTLLFQSRFLS